MIPTVAVIPFRDSTELTVQLLKDLADNPPTVLILCDNGATTIGRRSVMEWARIFDLRFAHCTDKSLSQMWNMAWDEGLWEFADQDFNLALLNDDLRVPQGFLDRLASELRAKDDLWLVAPDHRIGHPVNQPGTVEYVSGTYRHGGVHGAAYMVRGEARRLGLPPVDERFSWWYVDDDLVFAVEASGHKVGRIGGLGYEHVGGGSQTLDQHPDQRDRSMNDGTLCREKWGR